MAADGTARPLRLAVDLTQLHRGGENGGVKPFAFAYLRWLGRQNTVALTLLFLTRRASHGEVRCLARAHDELICLIDDDDSVPIGSAPGSAAERLWSDPPSDLLRQLGADVLYCPFTSCRWHFPGVRTIATVVDVLHRDFPQTLADDDIAQREAIFADTVYRADLIQVISRHTFGRMVHHYGVPPERLFCSPIVIHDRLRSAPAVAPPATANSRPYFLYPANAWRHKNHETLLLAFQLYRREQGAAAWDLTLTGHDDDAMRAVLARAAALGLADAVHYLGFVDEPRYAAVWRDAGALVFPSLHEGFGIPLVEAMAFGLPIVSSSLTSLPEVGGEACLYVDATSSTDLSRGLANISGNAALRAELRQRGQARLGGLSFERDAAAFLDKIVACAALPPRPTNKGFHGAGRTDDIAAVLPPPGPLPAMLHLSVHASETPRTLRVELGAVTEATLPLPAGIPTATTLQIRSNTEPLVLRATGNNGGAPGAVRLASMVWCDAAGHTTVLAGSAT